MQTSFMKQGLVLEVHMGVSEIGDPNLVPRILIIRTPK